MQGIRYTMEVFAAIIDPEDPEDFAPMKITIRSPKPLGEASNPPNFDNLAAIMEATGKANFPADWRDMKCRAMTNAEIEEYLEQEREE